MWAINFNGLFLDFSAQCKCRLRHRSNCSVFVQKKGEKNLRFCESVHTDPHKNATKTEVFENAVKSGYPQKRRFLKTHFINVNAQKRRFLRTHLINVNAQKRRFLKTLQYPTISFTKTEQCERTKTDVFRCVFVIWQISVNAQKRRFFSPFLYENGAVQTVASMQQKRILTKTE